MGPSKETKGAPKGFTRRRLNPLAQVIVKKAKKPTTYPKGLRVPWLNPLARLLSMDQTGTAVRVEKWRVNGELLYRVWGFLWGGDRPTDKLMIRFREDLPHEPLESYDLRDNRTWTLWSHTWRPTEPGRYQIALKVDDRSVRTRRLDRGYYVRQIDLEEV